MRVVHKTLVGAAGARLRSRPCPARKAQPAIGAILKAWRPLAQPLRHAHPQHAHDTPPHRHFDRGARFYDLVPVPTHPKRIRRALAAANAPLVDLGGGTGKYTARFASPALRPTVTDASRPMMLEAARKHRPIRLVQAVGHALPYRDRTIGAITATESFHHFVPGQERTLAECARVLADDGVLVIEEPDPRSVIGKLMFGGERMSGMGSEFHTPAALTALAERHFDDVTTARSGLFTYILTARDPRRNPPQTL